jgi:A/G-specific adenine glycosylase
VEALLPADPERAATTSVAFMELGALLCTPRAPRCADCPLRTMCAWRRSGGVLPDGPSRRRQRYAGTDRQVRGLLLAVLREAHGPVRAQRLDLVWGDPVQRERALSGLVDDGLVRLIQADLYALP